MYLAELRTQEETLPDAFDDARGNSMAPSGQGSRQMRFGHTDTALPVMAWLRHPKHLLFLLFLLCVPAAVSQEDEDSSHTSCLPPSVI